MLSVFGIVIYLTLEILRPEVVLPNPAVPVMTYVALATFVVFWMEILFRPHPWRSLPSTPYLAALVFIAPLSALVNGQPFTDVMQTFTDVFKLFFVYVVVSQAGVAEWRVKLVQRLLIVLTVWLAVGGVRYFYGADVAGFGLDREERLMYSGVFEDSNDLGQLYVITFALLLFEVVNGKNWLWKVPLGLSVAMVSWAIFLTSSRGAILGALVGIFLAFRKRVGTVAPAVVAFVALVAMNQLGIGRMDRLSMAETSADGRIKAWAQGWYMLRSSPLVGVGPRNFTDFHAKTAHNSLIQISAETGLLGMLCWVGFVFSPVEAALRYVWPHFIQRILLPRGNIEEPPLAVQRAHSGLLVCFVTGLFLSRAYMPLLYLMVALAAATNALHAPADQAAESKQSFVASLKTAVLVQLACLAGWRLLVIRHVQGP